MNPEENKNQPLLEANQISVTYGDRRVLMVPSFKVNPGQVQAVIGPNGSGKTTLLLCLSLLLKPTSGEIRYQGQVVSTGVPLMPLRRQFAVVFQEPLLLNTTVWENVTLGLRLRGVPKQEIQNRAQHWLERFEIFSLKERNARTLSGGEAQRTSLARAFALEPKILFLDEPFAALDVPTRQALFGDMINILQETRFTTVMVTHDRNEAQTLAHQVTVLMNGNIVQSGTPSEIFSAPVSEEIAKFVGMENILEGTVVSNRECLADINIRGQIIEGISTCQPGGRVSIFIRPEDITLSLDQPFSSARNVFTGYITSLLAAGPLVRVNLDCDFPLIALITKMSADDLKLEKGLNVYASFKATAIHVIPKPDPNR